ncbi:helix-turn-helix transcriptional regulator [Paenibacillus sp. 598K]|uniref:helix-turn-helix transcriptional regulator n=1 Tax=Paenibacillus sp. 598K TaxID=1117987 RepID=UPI001624307A|nr:helix-turn-helix transcriptional regulator [Paenibacillus sp. 598K]
MRPDIPVILGDLVMKLLSKLPEDRYQSIYGLLADLEQCAEQLRQRGVIPGFELGRADRRSRLQLPEVLYEREAFLEQLRSSYAEAVAGAVETVLVGGRAGSGKTALLKAFRAVVFEQSGHFLAGAFDLQTAAAPYLPLVQAIRELAARLLGASDAELDYWRGRITAAVGQQGAILLGMIPELVHIIGEQPPLHELPPSETTVRLHQVFCGFLRALADAEHPLVLCLDNMQWADPASLQLLRALMSDPDSQHLLILLAFRNDGFDAAQVLLDLLLTDESVAQPRVQLIELRELGLASVKRYVVEALHSDPCTVKPLAEALYQKTAGNPFYLEQMLQRCYNEGWLRYREDGESSLWIWELAEIQQQESFEDVVGLIVCRFEALPAEVRRLLRSASCFGRGFELEQLALLEGIGTETVRLELQSALEEGLILLGEEMSYRFSHDEVQRAIYEAIPAAERERLHQSIGRQLQRQYGGEDMPALQLFEIAHHANLGSGLMREPEQREQLARINLQAGKLAKATAAHVQALELLQKGIKLVEAEGWSRYGELYAELLLESSECQYCCGYFDRAEHVLKELLGWEKAPQRRARIYVIQMTMCAYRKRDGQAAKIAIHALAELGLKLPAAPSRLGMAAEMLRTRAYLARRPQQLEQGPTSDDPIHLAMADIITLASSLLFMTHSQLATFMLARYVRIAADQRHDGALAIGLSAYAIALCYGLHDYERSLRLAEQALQYAERTGNARLQGIVLFMNALILQFLRPGESDRCFAQAEAYCASQGDLVYAGYAISSRLITQSQDLRLLEQLWRHYARQLHRLDDMTKRVVGIVGRYLQLLRTEADTSRLRLDDGDIDEALLERLPKEGTHVSHLLYYYTCKLEVSYLHGRYGEAAAVVEQSRRLKATMLLSYHQRYCFYSALTMMTIYADAPPSLRRSYRKALKRLLGQMKKWTHVVPERTRAKYLVLLAESDRLNGKLEAACNRYDQAIDYARSIGDAHDEAIASERAARLQQTLHRPDREADYILRAHEAYLRWGADGVADRLQRLYPELRGAGQSVAADAAEPPERPRSQYAKPRPPLNAGVEDRWAMDALRHASKLDGSDAQLADLLGAFLQLALLNSGAERGLLLSIGEQGVVIEGARDVNDLAADGNEGGGGCYASSVVHHVRRTRQAVIVVDASQSVYATDPYIRQRSPRSILCMSLPWPGRQPLLVYLENNRLPGVMTTDCLPLLEMAFSRMIYAAHTYASSADAPEAAAAVATELASVSDLESVAVSTEMGPTIEVRAEPTMEPASLATTVADMSSPAIGPFEELSTRELDVLRLMAGGLSNKEIASRLGIKEGTVKIHAFNIYGKLQVNRRVQAITRARELRLLE